MPAKSLDNIRHLLYFMCTLVHGHSLLSQQCILGLHFRREYLFHSLQQARVTTNQLLTTVMSNTTKQQTQKTYCLATSSFPLFLFHGLFSSLLLSSSFTFFPRSTCSEIQHASEPPLRVFVALFFFSSYCRLSSSSLLRLFLLSLLLLPFMTPTHTHTRHNHLDFRQRTAIPYHQQEATTTADSCWCHEGATRPKGYRFCSKAE